MSYSPGRSSSSSAPSHPSSSPSSCRRPSSSARSWSLSQSLLQNATVGEASSATTTTPSTNSEHSAKKSVVLVKLTDAAIRALEEYVKLANEAAVSNTEIPKPSIKFPTLRDALGGFSIPLAAAAATAAAVPSASFAFSLSSTEDAQGPQGSFECLQADRPGSLQSVGPVQEKLQVQASDDSYTRFRQNVDKAQKESEKRTTQFLDRGPGSGSKSIARVYHPPRPAANRPASSSSSSSSSTPHMVNGQQKARNGNNHPSSSGAINNHHHPYLSGKHPMLDRKKNSPNSTMKPKPHHYHPPAPTNSEVIRRPLKERIIHLLAVRPYKKPELMARIIRDGIREKDKKNITGYLKQVSFMKDNTYHLHRHMWNDVSEDWQFYSEQERQMMKRRKPQNLTPPASDGSTSSSGHSPAQASRHTMPTPPRHPLVRDPPPPQDKRGLKRPRPSPGGGQTVAEGSKKARLSNYVRPADMQRYGNGYNSSSPSSEPGLSPRPAGGILDKSPRKSPSSGLTRSPNGGGAPSPLFGQHGGSPHAGSHLQQNGNGTAIATTTTTPLTPPAAVAQQQQEPQQQEPQQQEPQQHEQQHEQQQQQEPQQAVLPDYQLEYRRVESKVQRDFYKQVFTKERPKYLELYRAVDKVSERFKGLEMQMRQLEHGSPAWKRMKSKIVQEYAARQSDHGYSEQKKELQYLHMKLAHIKGLVTKYDEMQVRARVGGHGHARRNGSLAVE